MTTSIFAGLSQETTQEELLSTMAYCLMAILEKLPRTDSADRMMANIEAGTVAIASTTYLPSLYNAGSTSRPLDAAPMHFSNSASMHLYNNIIVS